MSIQERFDKIGVFGKGVLSVYDSRHAVQEFRTWFSSYDLDYYKKVIAKGVKAILRSYGLAEDNYMIIDKKSGMRIPLEIREDNFNVGFMIGVTPTTLAPHKTTNLRNEVEVFIEKHENEYACFRLVEGFGYDFNYYSYKGGVVSNFVEIEV